MGPMDSIEQFFNNIEEFYKRYSEFAICIENYTGRRYSRFYSKMLDLSWSEENQIILADLKEVIVSNYKNMLKKSFENNPLLTGAKKSTLLAKIEEVSFTTNPIEFLKTIRSSLVYQLK